MQATVAELRRAPQVAAVDDPYEAGTIAADGRTAYATVSYPVGETEVSTPAREALLAAGDAARAAGLGVEYSGEVTDGADDAGAAEVLGLAVAAVVLLVTFGSLLAAGLPLLTALIGVGTGMLGIGIATGFFDLASNASALATMLGLAVGIDYALFILSRYRHELAHGAAGEEAAGRAVGTAGSAVVFAGLTVIIALATLTVVGIPGHQGPRTRRPGPAGGVRCGDRRRDPGRHRPDRDRHRRLRPDQERATAVPCRGDRTRVPPADAGVPQRASASIGGRNRYRDRPPSVRAVHGALW